MNEEFGKWLMDIAKYMITALLLSSIFNDMKGGWLKVLVLVAAAAILIGGMYIINNKRKEKKL